MEPPDVREEVEIDGRTVVLRTLRPADREREAAFVRALSPESRYYRFHSGMRELTPTLLDRFTHVDYPTEMALCATVVEGGAERVIGVARWAPAAHDPKGAEIAIAVADAWQGRRLGATLLTRLRDLAVAAGVRRLYATVLGENRRMLDLARFLGFHVDPASRAGGAVVLHEPIGAGPGEDDG